MGLPKQDRGQRYAVFLRGGDIRPGQSINFGLNSASLFAEGRVHRFDGHTGIFGIEFYYRTYNPEKSSSNFVVLDTIGFILDDLIEEFNLNIENTERMLTQLEKQVLRSDGEEDVATRHIGPTIVVYS